MTTSPTPRLSCDLERYIFEICALSRPVLVPKLMLIAWRVKEVEPLLYRTIAVQFPTTIDGYPIFTWDVLMSAIHSKPASFFHRSVRNVCLFLYNDATLVANAQNLLSVCTGTENLAIFIGIDRLVPLIASLPLKRLYTHGKALFRDLPVTHPLFTHITHLGLGNATWLTQEHIRRFTLMPRLTHLSFSDISDLGIAPCLDLLQTCRSLSVLIVHINGGIEASQQSFPALARDPRFVVMRNAFYVPDWQMGALVGTDYWTRAEDFIAQRRSGEVNALQYEIPGDASYDLV
ncbi:hypothetical protein B0H19DRAFT_140188 [Mycena capillaripes]|nr:hypothetical protein B0H19DRAFT_140188 [Mycena capillaripes]